MLLSIPIGTTSKIIQLPIFDSSSTTGALLTGLVFNTASLTAYYNREGVAGAAVAITLATATKGTWATGGFVAVDGTNTPGWYELHIPDAALASGAKSVVIHLKGATNMVPVPILIELTATSNQDAVRGGMTALPASGTLAVNPILNATQTGVTIPTVTTLTGHTAQTGDNFARLGAPAGASVSADVAAVKVDTAAVKVKTDFLPSVIAGGTGGVFIAGTNAATTITTSLTTTFTGNLTGSAASVTGLTAATVHADLDDIQARLPAALVGGRIDASAGAIAANAITAASIAADAGVELRGVVIGTADSGTTTSFVDTERTEADVDYWRGQEVVFTNGTLLGQARLITAFNPTTDAVTFTPATTVAVGTHTYEIRPATDAILAQLTHTGAVVPTVSAVTGLTASNLDTTVSSRMATYTQPTGFLAATFPGTVASTTNITAATGITVATNSDKTGYSLTQTFPANFAARVISAGGTAAADVTAVAGATATATKLSRVLIGNVTGTVGSASTTTSIVTSALDPAASVTDQYKGRILTFADNTTTAALRGQSTDITASTSLGVLTCTALTTAAVSGDTLVIS